MAARVIHDFLTVLKAYPRGKLIDKLDEKMREINLALGARADEGGSATLTLTVTFTRAQDRIAIKPTVKIKLPDEKGFGEMTLFAVEDGLSFEHPSQLDSLSGPRAVDDRAAR